MEEPSRKRRREDEGGGWEESEERVPKKFRVVMRDVAAGPVRMEASVAEEAVSLWRAAKPSEAEKRKEADLLAHLKRIAVKWMHKATVNLYSPALATMEEPSRKRRREDEEEGEESEERVPKKFRVVMRDVAAGPVRMEASVAEEAVSLWRAAKPSEAEKRKEADLLAHLKRIAAKWMHKATVNLYGSRATGIGATTGDDVDATITWPGYNPEKSADKAMEEAFSKKLTKLCITLHQKGFQS
eukprot:gene20829-32115_t